MTCQKPYPISTHSLRYFLCGIICTTESESLSHTHTHTHALNAETVGRRGGNWKRDTRWNRSGVVVVVVRGTGGCYNGVVWLVFIFLSFESRYKTVWRCRNTSTVIVIDRKISSSRMVEMGDKLRRRRSQR